MSNREEFIDRKIRQAKQNIEHNKLEKEFAEKRGKDASRYEKRIAELEKDIKTLEEMRDAETE